MIRVTALYPNKDDARFDFDYYLNKHIPMAAEKLGAKMVRAEVDKGVAGGEPGSPPPFVAVAHLFFESIEDFQSVFAEVGGELMADVPNYTNIEPVFQISEVQDL